jgi:hypothetical protein
VIHGLHCNNIIMQNIIISLSELSKQNWSILYKFCKSLIEKLFDEKLLEELQTIAIISTTEQSHKSKNIYSSYGKTFTKDIFKSEIIDNDFSFVVIYCKKDSHRNFSNLLPFFYIEKEFPGFISLGIDINQLNEEDKNRYYFSCDLFLYYFKNKYNTNGGNQFYFIENIEFVDKETGEIIKSKTKSLPKGNENIIVGSRFFSPLIEINEENKNFLFYNNGLEQVSQMGIMEYIQESIKKLKTTSFVNDILKDFEFRNFFEEYFIRAFLFSFGNKSTIIWENTEDIIFLLRSYCDDIKELVENIIFYTTKKQGLFYFAFNRKNDILEEQAKYLTNFEEYKSDDRFVEIYILDFNKRGILDTFSNETSDTIILQDFFDIKSIRTTKLDYLDFRHTAHLGLKSFSKSIVNNKGFFAIETNNNLSKSLLKCFVGSNNEFVIKSLPIADRFIDGTHYEIILPVKPQTIRKENRLTSYQTNSFSEILTKWLEKDRISLSTIKLSKFIDKNEISKISNKDEQISYIQDLGDAINKEYNEDIIITINLENCLYVENALLFKLLSYLQLSKNQHYEIIVLYRVDNAFIFNLADTIEKLLINNNSKIWNNNTALVLITDNLRYQIVSGETVHQINYLNKIVNQLYPNKNSFNYDVSDIENKEEFSYNQINKYVLPYELFIKENNETLFEQYVSNILENNIEETKIGYKLNTKYTKLGSKIITKNYYEADTLFQNNFFTDRFAYLICKELLAISKAKNVSNTNKKIVLIGYCLYSEMLIKTIQRFTSPQIHSIIIANDINNDISWEFDNGGKYKILEDPNRYYYTTIVPIGSTMTTNDKLISKFKQFVFENSNGNKVINNENFIYNCSAILVRDNCNKIIKNGITKLESEIGWKSCIENVVKTKFVNSKEIHFFIQKNGEWLQPINNEISFPEEFREETLVNLTKNSSLNSQNSIGYPKVKYISNIQYNTELERLEDFKDYIFYGHILKSKDHYRYYFDTEQYAKDQRNIYNKWLKNNLKNDFEIYKNNLNILITPNINTESNFVNKINMEVFNNSAFVIYLDINNSTRNNIVYKLSFLKNLNSKEVVIHFVDHVLLTGESYKKAISYIQSIFGRNIKFSSIITLINRLSFDRNQEANNYVNNENLIHSFINIFIPPSKDPERDCSLCSTISHYEDNIIKNTTLDSCYRMALKKKIKIELKEFSKEESSKISNREFTKLKMLHSIYYNISRLVHNNNKNNFKNVLDNEVTELLNKKFSEVRIDFEAKLCFFKVISSYPLSQYIQIRNYAHKLLQTELNNLLTLSSHNFDSYLQLLIILKQLSFLGSNALIRKQVIVNSWKLYFEINIIIQNKLLNIEADIEAEKQKSKNAIDLEIVLPKKKKRIKEVIQSEEIKFDQSVSIDDNILFALENEKIIWIERNEKIKDFKYLFQLYIKNTIVNDEAKSLWLGELLRTGNEITDFKNISITKTNTNNVLFNHFSILHDEKFESYFKEFLVLVFYDNTTIIRKTLNNFEKEVYTNKILKSQIFDDKGSLKKFENINVNYISAKFKSIIGNEYYYNYIEKYLGENKDISILNKLVNLLYAKILLENLNKRIKTDSPNIEEDICSLLEVFAKIMDADAAFFSMKNINKSKIFTLSSYNIGKTESKKIQLLDKDYYTYQILQKEGKYAKFEYIYPIIRKDDLLNINQDGSTSRYLENSELGHNRLNLLLINNTSDKQEPIGSITFLYKDEKTDRNELDSFKIKSQENGRLLLILKKNLYNYIDSILNDKLFELWIEKIYSVRKFDKIYIESDHNFGKYAIPEENDLDKLNFEDFKSIHKSWFLFSNMIISHLYSNIERNGKLTIEIPSKKILLSSIFDEKFLVLIKSFEKNRWIGSLKIENNITSSAKTVFQKQILRTFVIHCLDNSMKKHFPSENKNIKLILYDDFIEINNDCPDEYFKEISSDKTDFLSKKKFIVNLKCDDYSSTTLTSLQGYCNKYKFQCKYGYVENNFQVVVNLK